MYSSIGREILAKILIKKSGGRLIHGSEEKNKIRIHRSPIRQFIELVKLMYMLKCH